MKKIILPALGVFLIAYLSGFLLHSLGKLNIAIDTTHNQYLYAYENNDRALADDSVITDTKKDNLEDQPLFKKDTVLPGAPRILKKDIGTDD